MRMLQKGIVALACAAAVLLLAPQTAQAEEVDGGEFGSGFTWSLDSEGTLTITGTGAMKDFEKLSDGSTSAPWYADRTKIKKVVLSKGITSVGERAFARCENLTEVELPAGLKTIGEKAFYACDDLTALELPAGLETIGDYAFDDCDDLTTVTFPAGLNAIREFAFLNCDSLTQVTLPGSLTSMGNYVFQNCTRLTTVTFEGTTAPTIGFNPFNACDNLTAIYVPEGATGYTADKGWLTDKVMYPISLTAGGAGGTASADRSSAAEGTTVTLQAEAAEGYHFKEWQASPGTVVVQPDGTFTMPDEAVTITAVFEAHTGSAATCKERAVRAVCGEAYGELADHRFVWVTDREATAE